MLSDSESSDSDSGVRFKTTSTREKSDTFAPARRDASDNYSGGRAGARGLNNGKRDQTAAETSNEKKSGENESVARRDRQRKDDKDQQRSKEQNRERDREFNRERDREREQQQLADGKHRGGGSRRSESRDRKRRSDSQERSNTTTHRTNKQPYGGTEKQRSQDRTVTRVDVKRPDEHKRSTALELKTDEPAEKRKLETTVDEKPKPIVVNPFKIDAKSTKPSVSVVRNSEKERSTSTATALNSVIDAAESKAHSRDKQQSHEVVPSTSDTLSSSGSKIKRTKHKKHKHTRSEERHRNDKESAIVIANNRPHNNDSRATSKNSNIAEKRSNSSVDRTTSLKSSSSLHQDSHQHDRREDHRDSKSTSSSNHDRHSKSRSVQRADSATRSQTAHTVADVDAHHQRRHHRSRSNSRYRTSGHHRSEHQSSHQHHQYDRSHDDNGDSSGKKHRLPAATAAATAAELEDDAMCGPKLPPHLMAAAVASRDRSSSPLVLSSPEPPAVCGPTLPPPKSSSVSATDRSNSSRHHSSSAHRHQRERSSGSHSPIHHTTLTQSQRRAHGPIAPTAEFLAAAAAAQTNNGRPSTGDTMSDISDEEDLRNRIVVIDETRADDVDDDDIDDAIIGPLPDGHSSKTEAHLELEKRALELKLAKFTDMETSEEMVIRDEWMLELPEVRGCVTDMGLTARQFRTKERPEIGDRSGWTETPKDREDRRRKTGREAAEREPTTEELREAKQIEARQLYNERRDRDQEEQARKHKKRSKRDESLMDLHQKKLKKEKRKRAEEEAAAASSRPARRPFSREDDLKVNRFDQAQKNAILKKAQLLDTRFGRGETKYL